MSNPRVILTQIHWTSTKVANPEKSGRYLAYSIGGCHFSNIFYSKRHDKWNASDDEDVPSYAFDVDYWAPVPDVFLELKEDYSDEQD